MFWQPLSADRARKHGVQFFKPDERFLDESVGEYLAEGLRNGASAVVVSLPARRERFVRRLQAHGIETAVETRKGRLFFLDSASTVESIFASSDPAQAFRDLVVASLDRAQAVSLKQCVRAYGDMVGLLWQQGRQDEMELLEAYWSSIIDRGDLDLLCGYPIDILSPAFHMSALDRILRSHSHVVPARENGVLDHALDRSLEEVLGPRADAIRKLIRGNTPDAGHPDLPRAEAAIVWLRRNLPDHVEHILERVREYGAS